MSSFIRTFKIIFFTLIILLFLIFIASLVFLKTFDINQFRDSISEYVGDAVGKEVSIGHVAYHVSPQRLFAIQIDNIQIRNDKVSTGEPIFRLKSAYLDFNISKLIFEKVLDISKIELVNADIFLVRGKNGEFNFMSPPSTVASEKHPSSSSQGKQSEQTEPIKKNWNEKTSKSKTAREDFPEISVRGIEIKNSRLTYQDLNPQNLVDLQLTNLDAFVSNFSLDRWFDFKMSFSALGEDFQIPARMKIDRKEQQFILSDLTFQMNLAKLSFPELRQRIFAVKEVPIGNDIAGDVKLSIKELEMGIGGLLNLTGEGSLTDGKVYISTDPGQTLSNIDINFTVKNNVLDIRQAFLYFASGKIDAKAKIEDFLSRRLFQFDASFEQIQIPELIKGWKVPAKIQGTINGVISAKGSLPQPDSWKTSLDGKGALSLENGKVLDFNVLKFVLDNITVIPNFKTRIFENLPQEYQDKLTKKDTIINEASTEFQLKGPQVEINKFRLSADDFLATAAAKLGFDLYFNLIGADIYIPKELSEAMVASVEELSFLKNNEGRIQIPMRSYKGPVTTFKTYPDIEDLGKKMLQQKGKQELKKVIFKALNLDEREPPSSDQDQNFSEMETDSSKTIQKTGPRPEEELINNILDSIFK